MAAAQTSPIAAVSAIIVKDGSVLLVKRAAEPNKGLWAFPGGRIELGERAREAVVREVREETSVVVDVGDVVDVRDVITGPPGRVEHHYVVVNFRAAFISGELKADSDAADARWVPLDLVHAYPTTPGLIDRLASLHLL